MRYDDSSSRSSLMIIQLFKVNIQADTIGNRLKEVQDKAKDLATFGTEAVGRLTHADRLQAKWSRLCPLLHGMAQPTPWRMQMRSPKAP